MEPPPKKFSRGILTAVLSYALILFKLWLHHAFFFKSPSEIKIYSGHFFFFFSLKSLMTFNIEKKILTPQLDVQGYFSSPATQATLRSWCMTWSPYIMAHLLPIHLPSCHHLPPLPGGHSPITIFTFKAPHPSSFCSKVTSGIFTSHSPAKHILLCWDIRSCICSLAQLWPLLCEGHSPCLV